MVTVMERAHASNESMFGDYDSGMFGLNGRLVITDPMSRLGQTIVPPTEPLFALSALSTGLPGLAQLPAVSLAFNTPKLDVRMGDLGQSTADRAAAGGALMAGGLIAGTLQALMFGFLWRNIGHEQNNFWKIIGYLGLASTGLGVIGSLAAVVGGGVTAAKA